MHDADAGPHHGLEGVFEHLIAYPAPAPQACQYRIADSGQQLEAMSVAYTSLPTTGSDRLLRLQAVQACTDSASSPVQGRIVRQLNAGSGGPSLPPKPCRIEATMNSEVSAAGTVEGWACCLWLHAGVQRASSAVWVEVRCCKFQCKVRKRETDHLQQGISSS